MGNEFREWALQFATIQEKHIAKFAVRDDVSLHEMKQLFAEKYQDRIEFSYVLGVEKLIVKNLHIEKIRAPSDRERGEDLYGHGYIEGDGHGYKREYKGHEYKGDGYGYKEGEGNLYGQKYGYGYVEGDGSGCGYRDEKGYGKGHWYGDGYGYTCGHRCGNG